MSEHFVEKVTDNEGEEVRFIGSTVYGGGRSLGWTGYSYFRNTNEANSEVRIGESTNLTHLNIPPSVVCLMSWWCQYKYGETGSDTGYRYAYLNNEENSGTKVLSYGYGAKSPAIGGGEGVVLSGESVCVNTSTTRALPVYLKTEQVSGGTLHVNAYGLKCTILSGVVPEDWEW